MIRPDGFRGTAFGTAVEADARSDDGARKDLSRLLGISSSWAWVTQVHSATVVEATTDGLQGDADGILTTVQDLPVSVATADCVPVVIEGPGVAAVVHAGWRGAVAGVVERMLEALVDQGTPPMRAAIGPAIGPCCYEVGPEVAQHFPAHVRQTRWGTLSVDLGGFVADLLAPVSVWRSEACTFTDVGFNSHRRDRTRSRQIAVGWLPSA